MNSLFFFTGAENIWYQRNVVSTFYGGYALQEPVETIRDFIIFFYSFPTILIGSSHSSNNIISRSEIDKI